MAPRTLRPTHPTQIQKRTPSGWFFSGRSTNDTSSSSSLTADPRVDDVDNEVEHEVDEYDAHRDDEHYPLDQEIVAHVDRGDQRVAESRNGEQVLHDEAAREQAADVDPGRTE